MNKNFRLPKITAGSTENQLRQMQSFLQMHIRQLNQTMNELDGGSAGHTPTGAGGSGSGSGTGKTPAATFNEIKSLIIKSADIVNAYYDQINARLEGIYVAESDFGAYAEQTSQDIQANSTSIEQLFTDLQVLSGTVDGLYDDVLSTNAYVKTGLLYYDDDGVPVYGMEIGQTNAVNGEEVFDKFARFASDRLSFYDKSETEVAYISDYKLHITHAEITGSLTVGGYVMDTSDGLAWNWVGGES